MRSFELPTFEAIHREFRPKVLRYLRGYVHEDEAADLAQLTMLKVSEHLADFRGESTLSTWIYRIATNVALDRLRQRSPERVTLEGEAADDDEPAETPPQLQAPSTEATVIRQEMSACVREFVGRLPENYRGILVLSEVEGMSNAEIARATGLTLETVKIRLHRAREKLRNELQSGCTLHRDENDELACDRKPPGGCR